MKKKLLSLCLVTIALLAFTFGSNSAFAGPRTTTTTTTTTVTVTETPDVYAPVAAPAPAPVATPAPVVQAPVEAPAPVQQVSNVKEKKPRKARKSLFALEYEYIGHLKGLTLGRTNDFNMLIARCIYLGGGFSKYKLSIAEEVDSEVDNDINSTTEDVEEAYPIENYKGWHVQAGINFNIPLGKILYLQGRAGVSYVHKSFRSPEETFPEYMMSYSDLEDLYGDLAEDYMATKGFTDNLDNSTDDWYEYSTSKYHVHVSPRLGVRFSKSKAHLAIVAGYRWDWEGFTFQKENLTQSFTIGLAGNF